MSGLTPAQIEEARALYAKNYTPHRVARHMTRRSGSLVTAEQVREVVDLRASGYPINPEIKAKARTLRLQGLTPREIANRLGIPVRTAKSACEGITLTEAQYAEIRLRASETSIKRIAEMRRDGVFAAANAARRAAQAARGLIQCEVPAPVEVPGWVPEHLYEFYEHAAQRSGEEIAASLVRQLKRGNAVAGM